MALSENQQHYVRKVVRAADGSPMVVYVDPNTGAPVQPGTQGYSELVPATQYLDPTTLSVTKPKNNLSLNSNDKEDNKNTSSSVADKVIDNNFDGGNDNAPSGPNVGHAGAGFAGNFGYSNPSTGLSKGIDAVGMLGGPFGIASTAFGAMQGANNVGAASAAQQALGLENTFSGPVGFAKGLAHGVSPSDSIGQISVAPGMNVNVSMAPQAIDSKTGFSLSPAEAHSVMSDPDVAAALAGVPGVAAHATPAPSNVHSALSSMTGISPGSFGQAIGNTIGAIGHGLSSAVSSVMGSIFGGPHAATETSTATSTSTEGLGFPSAPAAPSNTDSGPGPSQSEMSGVSPAAAAAIGEGITGPY